MSVFYGLVQALVPGQYVRINEPGLETQNLPIREITWRMGRAGEQTKLELGGI